jgi:UDP-N-acetylglucosamine--N-acetylmuramyl-(pentapeptide) pyrophosphoryl-undecaprenol N-acetylglucosamine transferase
MSISHKPGTGAFFAINKPVGEVNIPRKLLIAGGGTGGHLFPGIAIAREFISRKADNRVLFVSTGNPFEKSALSKAGFQLAEVVAAGIKGMGPWHQLISLLRIPIGILGSIRILKNFKPDLVLGVGSYAAGPVVMAAWLMRKKIVLHEQNLLPGITNRLLSRFADRIYVSFEESRDSFDSKKVRVTGNPVREEILQHQNQSPASAPEPDHTFTVLVIGGSQGAHGINMAVIETLTHLRDKHRYRFLHQTGSADEVEVKAAYEKHGIPSTVKSFFQDMDRRYQAADLIVCRAGATTVAEVTALGKSVIFIPFPFAADDHQTLNARALVENGAAEMILQKDLTGQVLSQKIEYYAANRKALGQMAAKAGSFGKPRAAREIVDDIYELTN